VSTLTGPHHFSEVGEVIPARIPQSIGDLVMLQENFLSSDLEFWGLEQGGLEIQNGLLRCYYTTDFGRAHLVFKKIPEGVVEWEARVSSVDVHRLEVRKNTAAAVTEYLGLAFQSTGEFCYLNADGAWDSTGVSYSTNTWYRFVEEWNAVSENNNQYIYDMAGNLLWSREGVGGYGDYDYVSAFYFHREDDEVFIRKLHIREGDL